jgi:hypothetical protein
MGPRTRAIGSVCSAVTIQVSMSDTKGHLPHTMANILGGSAAKNGGWASTNLVLQYEAISIKLSHCKLVTRDISPLLSVTGHNVCATS